MSVIVREKTSISSEYALSARRWYDLRLVVAAILLFAAGMKAFPPEMLTAQEAEIPAEAGVSPEIKSGENENTSDSETPSTEPSQAAPSETPSEQTPTEAEMPKQVLPNLKEMEVSGPYCGIYALLVCFDAFDLNPPLEELLVPEYVGSFEGSSNAELIAAAEKFGLHGKTYSNLTRHELKSSSNPMILHFRSSYADSKFNHWVAYLGADGHLARIIDLPHEIATVPFAELMAKWDGTAIEISREPITGQVANASRTHYLLTAIVLLVCCFALQRVVKCDDSADWFALSRGQRFKRVIPQSVGLAVCLFFFGIVYHAMADVGFLKNPSAVAEVTRRYYSVDVPEISLAEMEKAVADEPETRIFDARYARDFQKGSILRGVSMSINSNLEERRELLAGVDKNCRIIVFCQSAGCGYADEVAQFLKFNGYRNTVIYRGGWRQWKEKNESSDEKTNTTANSDSEPIKNEETKNK